MHDAIEQFLIKDITELCSLLNESDHSTIYVGDKSDIAPQHLSMIINTIIFSKAEGLLFVKSFFRLYIDVSNMINYIAKKSIRSNNSNEHNSVMINADLELPLFIAYLKTFFERLSEEEKNKWLENCEKFSYSLGSNFVGYAMSQIYSALYFLQDKDSSKKDEDSSENSSILSNSCLSDNCSEVIQTSEEQEDLDSADEDEQNAEKIREYMGDNTISGKDLSDKKASFPKAEEIINDLIKSNHEEEFKHLAFNILMKKIDNDSLSITHTDSLISEATKINDIISDLHKIQDESAQKDSNYSIKRPIINDLIKKITSLNLNEARALLKDNMTNLKKHEYSFLLSLWYLISHDCCHIPPEPQYIDLIDNINEKLQALCLPVDEDYDNTGSVPKFL